MCNFTKTYSQEDVILEKGQKVFQQQIYVVAGGNGPYVKKNEKLLEFVELMSTCKLCCSNTSTLI